MMSTTFSVIGLGKLGASMAAAIASRGFNVIGVDANPLAVERLNAGSAPVAETGLQELIAANRERLEATLSHRDAVLGSDVSFVVVPTPSDEQGGFSLQYETEAFRAIGRALAEKSDYHLVVLTSTVLPGATRYGLVPVLEAESGKTCGTDFGVCYSPEFIALGSVIRDFLNPDFTLIGESDERAGSLLEQCYAAILANGAPSRRMSFENAELAKIALNTFVTTKISFANMLADICERLPGGDVDVVSDAIGLDRRVGRPYLTGGLGFGGPCFPRDNVALAYFARSLGAEPLLPDATHRANDHVVQMAIERIHRLAPTGGTVAVLGLAYKPMSHVVERSQGLEIARRLAQRDVRVLAYDPLAADSARQELGASVQLCGSIEECLTDADVVVVTTPDPAFRSLRTADLLPPAGQRRTVVDFWRIIDPEIAAHPALKYIAAGRGQDAGQNANLLGEMWLSSNGNAPARRIATAVQ
jgi:UDPglucose 6-dehydrogenase